MKNISSKIIVITLILTVLSLSSAYACTKFVYTGNDNIVLTGRTTDWSDEVSTNLWLLPRGIKREGLAGKNSIKWTSKYGSVVATVHNIMTIDGMNEKGLTMSILRLKDSEFIPENKIGRRKGLGIALWGQYFLDNFATVVEATKYMEKDNIYVMPFNIKKGENSGMHLVISDAKGDFAVFEYTDGQLHIYKNPKYKIATNSPKYSDQIAINYYWESVDGKFLPGTRTSSDRFSRGAYYLNKLPKTNNQELAMAYVMSLLRNVSSPLGIRNSNSQEESATLWKTISDNKNKIYYYESSYKNYGFNIDLKKIDFAKDQEIKFIDLMGGKYYFGDATDKFVKTNSFKFFPSYEAIIDTNDLD